MNEFFDRARDRFLDLQTLLADRHANSIAELLAFAALVAGLFGFLHYQRHARARRDRARIPLVVGGWGSRGKSGTERLKAALFNGMGRSLLCKTTGCEPVLLYGKRFGSLEEIPLHRSYDKATIWEQLDVLHIAAEARVDVFLWECMGLNPDYVQLMQKDWMRDDISTITNTYPDHEDIQGPAGYNVAESIASFIPPGGNVITSEHLMAPILQQRCREENARLERPTAADLICITEDVLNRFPYAEHPHNIALTLALARKLGVSQDFALKEMADRIKPDIGVLKVYPSVRIDGRTLEFSNGFSANEKFGCVSNWERLGFHRQNLEEAPKVWLTALVNNREDRVTRSQVFAQLLAVDVELDEYYLVGTNQEGFIRFYYEAIRTMIVDLELSTVESARQVLMEFGRRLRIPCSERQHEQRVQGLPSDNHITVTFRAWQALLLSLDHTSDLSLLSGAIRRFLTQCFRTKMICFAFPIDPSDLVQKIVASTPLGFENKIHGMQNIKGIGLRWLELWEEFAQFHKKYSVQDPIAPPAGTQTWQHNPLCLAHSQLRGSPATGTSRVDSVLNRSRPGPSRGPRRDLLAELRGYGKALVRPNAEAMKTQRIKKVYKDFALGRWSASEARSQIRTLQGEH